MIGICQRIDTEGIFWLMLQNLVFVWSFEETIEFKFTFIC